MGLQTKFTSSSPLYRPAFAARSQKRTQNTQRSRKCYWHVFNRFCMSLVIEVDTPPNLKQLKELIMKIWNKPQVREQAVGMEVTAYLPADIDLI